MLGKKRKKRQDTHTPYALASYMHTYIHIHIYIEMKKDIAKDKEIQYIDRADKIC